MSNKQVMDLIKEQLSATGTAGLTVTGNSMAPLFKDKKTVVELALPKKIKKYDILLYTRENGAVVLHRVVKVAKNGLWLRGDNDMVTEKGVPPTWVAALAIKSVTDGKEKNLQGLGNRLYGMGRCLRRTAKRLFVHKSNRGTR